MGNWDWDIGNAVALMGTFKGSKSLEEVFNILLKLFVTLNKTIYSLGTILNDILAVSRNLMYLFTKKLLPWTKFKSIAIENISPLIVDVFPCN